MTRIPAERLMSREVRHDPSGVTDFTGAPEKLVAKGPTSWIAPALFDIQINGCNGISFNSSTLTGEEVRQVVEACRHHGIGQFFPTLVTNSFDALAHGFRTLRQACETEPLVARSVPGFHLEGPFLSVEDGPRGAHPREHIRPPDWDEFQRLQEIAGGRIRLITLSPEYDESLRLIERLQRAGVVVAIGHTAAIPERIREAITAGARLSTHLGNGCHAVLPRHGTYLWEQLAADELWASFIPDGHHLPASFVKCLLRTKTLARCVVTCDASSLAGCAPGRYSQWGTELEVLPSGKVVVPDTPYLAGSGRFTEQCLSELLRMTNLTLAEALDLATRQPRELMGVAEPSEWIVFDWAPGEELIIRGWIDAPPERGERP